MKFFSLMVLCLFSLFELLSAQETLPVDFSSLQKNPSSYTEKNIEIRGFLFKKSKDQWILSDKPNIKSCCIGHINKQFEQIYLENTYEDHLVNQAVLVKGIFQKSNRLQLKQDVLIKEDKQSIFYIISFIGLVIGTVVLKKLWKDKSLKT